MEESINLDQRMINESGLQGSYKFLDPKFKTFPRPFSKKVIFFSDSRLTNRWSIETLNAGTKLFFMVHCTDTGEIEQDIDQNDKTSPLKHFLIVALKKKRKKKKTKPFTFFPNFSSSGKFQDLSKNSRLCTNPRSLENLKAILKEVHIAFTRRDIYAILACVRDLPTVKYIYSWHNGTFYLTLRTT